MRGEKPPVPSSMTDSALTSTDFSGNAFILESNVTVFNKRPLGGILRAHRSNGYTMTQVQAMEKTPKFCWLLIISIATATCFSSISGGLSGGTRGLVEPGLGGPVRVNARATGDRGTRSSKSGESRRVEPQPDRLSPNLRGCRFPRSSRTDTLDPSL